MFTLNGGAVTWRSSKQSTIVDSTTESEYIAVNEAVKETMWMRKFIGDLGVVPSIHDPVEIFCDNDSITITMFVRLLLIRTLPLAGSIRLITWLIHLLNHLLRLSMILIVDV